MEISHLHLDTHRIIKNLERRGYTPDQAEGILEAIEDIRLIGVATKNDIADVSKEINIVREEVSDVRNEITEVRNEIKDVRSEINDLRHEMNCHSSQLRAEIYKALFYQAFAVVGLTVTLLKFLG